MKLNNVTATLDQAELEQLVKDAIWLKMSLNVESVSFDVATRTVGYGMNERDEQYFKGATLVFQPGQRIGKIGD